MFEKLSGVEERFEKLEQLLSDPDVLSDRVAYQQYSREHSDLNKIVTVLREHRGVVKDLEDSMELLKDGDPEIKDLAKEEI